ncbi:MAG: RNA methyltransferase [Arachidicoccus sp.]|nr:RNA methyltransferase [Arachidicoccus sp.]
MISKNEIKYIQTLYHKKNRDAENVFIAEGTKLINELLQSDFGIKQIYATKEWLNTNSNVSAKEVSQNELEKISRLETPHQVLAIIHKKKEIEKEDYTNQITLLLDGIQDPGNLGTIIRIADWFGIQKIIATKDTADCFNPKTVQSTMGSIFRVAVYYKDVPEFLKENTIKVYGAMLNGKNIREHKPVKEGILIIGNESKGIRDNIKSFVEESLSIPAFGKAESLNAAVAAGIILSHIIQ